MAITVAFTLVFLFTVYFIVENQGEESPEKLQAKMPRGEFLSLKNNCTQCHKYNNSSSGPAYSSVRKKYNHGHVNDLIETISKGGAGKWGQVIMPPHPDLTINEIDTMVNWILAGDY